MIVSPAPTSEVAVIVAFLNSSLSPTYSLSDEIDTEGILSLSSIDIDTGDDPEPSALSAEPTEIDRF